MSRRVVVPEQGEPGRSESSRGRRTIAARESTSQAPAWRGSPDPSPGGAVQAPSAPERADLRHQISAERIAEARDSLRARARTARADVEQLARALAALGMSESSATKTAQEKVGADVRQRREVAERDVTRAHEERVAKAVGTLTDVRAVAAAGAASASWDALTVTPSAQVPTLIRFGHLDVNGVSIPALAPLLNEPGWYLSGNRAAGEELVVSLLTRLLALVPIRHLKIEVFDPRLRGILGRFTSLRNAFGNNFPQPVSDPAMFVPRIERLMESAGTNVELVAAAGAASILDLWRGKGVPEGRLNLCVVLDYPYGVDVRLQEKLIRAGSIGGPSGTVLLVVADGSTAADPQVDAQSLRQLLRPFVSEAGRWRNDDLPGHAQADPAPPAEVVTQTVAAAIESAERLQGPRIPLTDLIAPDLENPWTGSAAESLDVVIGREGSLPLTISLRTENPPHPNLLVGGAVGQGKSNLLLDIVYALATRYPPDELELHLLDFKRGLEFKRFAEDEDGRNWLPHARVLCLESSPAFGVAVLRHMDQEMDQRSKLFKAAGASSLNAYRAAGRKLARLVLIVDEFHVLFEGSDTEVDQAVTYLTRLAKQGRAYGIHLLLASQTITGVGALSVKGDAIFAQFPLRMSLKNTAAESQAILSQGNKEAADLTYRGEFILNRNFGHDPVGSNVRAVAAFADPDEMLKVQSDLWARGHGEPPMMFFGSSFADYRSLQPTTGESLEDQRIPLWIGRPIAVSTQVREVELTSDVDQCVAVVGQDAELAVATLRSMVASAAPSLAARCGRIVVLQGVEERVLQPLLDMVHEVGRHGVDVQVVPRTEVAAFLRDDMKERLAVDAEPWLVLGAGLQRVRGMDEGAPLAPGSLDLSFGKIDDTTAQGVLSSAATRGGLAGVHLVCWWPNLRAVRNDLAQAAGIGAYVTAGLGREDLRDLVGGIAPAIDGWPRVGLFDVNGRGQLEVLVPLDPTLAPQMRYS